MPMTARTQGGIAISMAERPLYVGLSGPEETPGRERRRAIQARRRFESNLAAVALAGVLLLGAVTAASAVAQAGYRLDGMQAQLVAAEAQHRQLVVEVAQLRSLSRLAQRATEMGLQQAPAYTPIPLVAVHDATPAAGHTVVLAVAPKAAGVMAAGLWQRLAAGARFLAAQTPGR